MKGRHMGDCVGGLGGGSASPMLYHGHTNPVTQLQHPPAHAGGSGHSHTTHSTPVQPRLELWHAGQLLHQQGGHACTHRMANDHQVVTLQLLQSGNHPVADRRRTQKAGWSVWQLVCTCGPEWCMSWLCCVHMRLHPHLQCSLPPLPYPSCFCPEGSAPPHLSSGSSSSHAAACHMPQWPAPPSGPGSGVATPARSVSRSWRSWVPRSTHSSWRVSSSRAR